MQNRNRWIVVMLLVLATLQIAGCSSAAPAAAKISPAIVEPSDVEGINRVTLTERAAERLAVETELIREAQVDGKLRLIAPYSSVIYDENGGTWLYTNPAPLTFVRQSITIDFIKDDMAVLTDGPDVGVSVATVAVAELYGTDTGVGK